MSNGPDGNAITAKVNGHLDYLSQLAKQLGVSDPVETHLTPLVGRWTDLHAEATRWRTAAKAAEDVTHRLTSPLGGLDAAWQGKDAESFLDYMRQVGLAGNDMSDAMNAMADALDKTAEAIGRIVQEMVDLLTDTAEQSSDAMTVPLAGESRARKHLEDVDEPTGQLHDSVRTVLQAFTKLCRGVQDGQTLAGVTTAHKMPQQNWAPAPPVLPRAPAVVPRAPGPAPAPAPVSQPAAHTPAGHVPTATAPAAAAAHQAPAAATHTSAAAAHLSAGGPAFTGHAANTGSALQQSGTPPTSGALASDPTTGSFSGHLPTVGGGSASGGAGSSQSPSGMPMGMGGMGGMRGGQGGDQEHKAKTRIAGDVKDIFGKPERTAPPTIGDN